MTHLYSNISIFYQLSTPSYTGNVEHVFWENRVSWHRGKNILSGGKGEHTIQDCSNQYFYVTFAFKQRTLDLSRWRSSLGRWPTWCDVLGSSPGCETCLYNVVFVFSLMWFFFYVSFSRFFPFCDIFIVLRTIYTTNMVLHYQHGWRASEEYGKGPQDDVCPGPQIYLNDPGKYRGNIS